MRLRGVEGGADVQRRAERAVDLLLAALRAREPVPPGPVRLCFNPAVGYTGPPVNLPREGEEQAETPR